MQLTWWDVLVGVLWGFVLLEGLLLLGVLRQLGVLHRRIDALEAEENRPKGLGSGTSAPDFTLPRLGGGRCSLREFRGRSVLVAFVHPTCQACLALLPHLDAVGERAGPGRTPVLIVSEGDRSVNERLYAELRLQAPMLLQAASEVADRFRVPYTPYVYALDAFGVVRGHGVVNTGKQLRRLVTLVEETEAGRSESDAVRRKGRRSDERRRGGGHHRPRGLTRAHASAGQRRYN